MTRYYIDCASVIFTSFCEPVTSVEIFYECNVIKMHVCHANMIYTVH